jgi:two-component system, sensor histidine kinase YesM
MNTGIKFDRMTALRQFHPLRRMKLIPKLAFSYIVTILLCISIVGGFYYQLLQSNIKKETTELFGNTILQARENIEYKVGLYGTMAETLYMNRSMQETLLEEYFDPISRAMALEGIQSLLVPLTDGYKDIKQLCIYVTNDTIVPFEEYIKSIKNVTTEEFYKSLSERDDNIRWLLYEERKVPGSGINTNGNAPGVIAPAEAGSEAFIKQLAMVKNIRFLRTGTYLGFLMVKLDIDSLFKDLTLREKLNGGWFDITDASGRLIFSGAGNSTQADDLQTDTVAGVQLNYQQHVQKPENNFTLNVDKRKFLVLREKIMATGWNILYVNPMERYQGDLKKLQLVTFLLVLMCLVLFILLSWWMASRFSQRIRILSQSMKHVQTGDFTVQIPVGGSDEIDELGSGFNGMVQELKLLLEEIHLVKEREKEAELKALQAQINPHFLYNTLASISYLGAEYGAGEVTRMSNSLARFYRLSLSKGKNIISIQDEIEHIKAYLDIQGVRFKNRIRVLYDIDEKVLTGCSPKLLLQPFVENSILHGMWINKKSITIRIVIREEAGLVTWSIIDDGVGMDRHQLQSVLGSDQEKERGYGAVNVDRRVKVFFGDQYGVQVFSLLGIGTVVTITTPFQVAEG